jgi:hypothetical protein
MLDNDFATSKDYLFADFKANEMLIEYLCREIKNLNKSNQKNKLLSTNYNWTDSKVAITEIIYAFAYSGSINNGNVDIKELAKDFCRFFNIDKLDFYRIYLDIRIRNNQTIYLDKLKKRLKLKMEEDLE